MTKIKIHPDWQYKGSLRLNVLSNNSYEGELTVITEVDQSDKETWPDQKKTMTKRKTKTMRKTNTFREHLQRAIPETCDLWDIWSEWWGDIDHTKKRQWQRQWQRQRQRHSESTFKEQS